MGTVPVACILECKLYEHFGIEDLGTFVGYVAEYKKLSMHDRFGIFFNYIKDVYTIYDCTDLPALADMFQVLLTHMVHRGPMGPYDALLLHDSRMEDGQYRMESGLMFNKAHGESSSLGDFEVDAVRTALTSGNVGALKVLLSFGATLFKPKDSMEEWCAVKQAISKLFVRPVDIIVLTDRCLENLARQVFHPSLRQRLNLVMLGIEVLGKIRSQPQHADNYRRCLRLVFKSIPEPAIRSQEVREALETLLRGAFDGNLEDELIREATDEFVRHFPESAEPMAPKSLEELSRLRVRQCGCFINKMYSWNIPKPVKNCILIKEDCHGDDDMPVIIHDSCHSQMEVHISE